MTALLLLQLLHCHSAAACLPLPPTRPVPSRAAPCNPTRSPPPKRPAHQMSSCGLRSQKRLRSFRCTRCMSTEPNASVAMCATLSALFTRDTPCCDAMCVLAALPAVAVTTRLLPE